MILTVGSLMVNAMASGPAWTPAKLGSKLLAWYSAAKQSTASQGQPQWEDHSGNGRTASGASAARTPTLVKHNNAGAFVFDGLSSDTTGDCVITDASFTNVKAIYLLVKHRGATWADFECILSSNTASPANSIIIGNTSAPSTAFLSLSPAPTFRKNGTTQAYTTAGSGPMNEYATLSFEWASPWTEKIRFGSQVSWPARHLPGSIVEVVVVNAALSAAEQTALEAYMETLKKSSTWTGKAVAYCGTSVPAGGSGAVAYATRVGEMLRVGKWDNNSQGSSRVVYTGSSSGASGYLSGTGAENSALGVSSTGSYQTKAIGYDHVIIDHGLNDYNTTMGTAGTGNTNRANFAGALGYLINAIRTANANTKVTLVTPMSLYALSGTISAQMTSVRQVIVDVADAWDTNLVDLTTLLDWDNTENTAKTADGTHPNNTGESEAAEALVTALQAITP